MLRQNRVDAFGNLIRTAARGTMMGNRGGALNNTDRGIVRGCKSRRWITCVLEFRDRHRVVTSPNRYAELFFLDESVAFAAGHRPCAECRRERYNAFKNAWQLAHRLDEPPFADERDLKLHSARIHKGNPSPLTLLDVAGGRSQTEIALRRPASDGRSVVTFSTEGKEAHMQQRRTVVVIAATIVLTGLVLLPDELGTSNWPQWGQNPQHQGFIGVAGQQIKS